MIEALQITRPVAPWTTGQKMLFRFCFIFFTLEVLFTPIFLDRLLLSNHAVWDGIDRLNEPVFLWLNNRFFHYPYQWQQWGFFKSPLKLVQDISFIMAALFGCIVWTLADSKRPDYYRLNYWFSYALRIALAVVIFGYGAIKVFPVQMHEPDLMTLRSRVGDLTPLKLMWAALGYGTSYMIFTGAGEVVAALLILHKRTLVPGLLLMLVLMSNIVAINYAYSVGLLYVSAFLLCMVLYLLAPYFRKLIRLFYYQQPVSLAVYQYRFTTVWKTYALHIGVGLLVLSSFYCNTLDAGQRFLRIRNHSNTEKKYRVNTLIVDNDTIPRPAENAIQWKYWQEGSTLKYDYVSIIMADNTPQNFKLKKDSVHHALTLTPIGGTDTTLLHFQYNVINDTSWILCGVVDKKNVVAEFTKSPTTDSMQFQKIVPRVLPRAEDE